MNGEQAKKKAALKALMRKDSQKFVYAEDEMIGYVSRTNDKEEQ